MKSRYAIIQKLRVPYSLHSRGLKSLYRHKKDVVSPSTSVFANIPPKALKPIFDVPGVTILKAPPVDERLNARFILFSDNHNTNPESDPESEPRPVLRGPSRHSGLNRFAIKMLNYAQITTTPTADTLSTSILLHFDNQRYVFGHIGEGTQRAFTQRKVALNKVENLFISGLVNWRSSGGLLGMILTIADVFAISKSDASAKKKTKTPTLNIHGGLNLTHLLATSRRFIFRKGLPLRPFEVRGDPPRTEAAKSEPDWSDENINVWYMLLDSDQKDLASTRKRSHDEFREVPNPTATAPGFESESEALASRKENDRNTIESVVQQIFGSTWSADALVETTLYQVKLPAKLFVRTPKGIQEYRGPLPGGDEEVTDVPVLVRLPWPGARVTSLPRTKPSKQSLCYIVKSHDRRGKFNPQAAEKLGVAKKDYRKITNLENVTGKDGNVVTPDMVLGEAVAGNGFAVVDLPSTSYIDSLVNRKEWTDSQIMKEIHVIFWILGSDVANDPRLQKFMQDMSSVKHIVTSTDTCPNMLALESSATQAYKLRCIDPDRFPLPAHSNVLSLSGTPTTTSSLYEIGRTGKTIQFAPNYIHQDDKIVPFPNIEKLAREDFDPEVLNMAAKARSKVSDPTFIEKVEKAEADIPNRDAEIITLGTGSALPSKYRNVSATLLRVPGYGNYLFDAGENTLGQMRRVFGDELPSILRDLKVIWISHLHADHHLGTAAVIKAWHEETSKSNPSAKLMVASHHHMTDWLREYADVENFGHERVLPCKFTKFDPQTRLSEIRRFTREETEQFGLTTIQGCWVNHCYAALGTAFTFPSGLKVVYSGDCRPSDELVQIGQGATILIHESTFDDEMQDDAIAKKHSTMSEAIDVGRRMGARRILLTHFSQRYQKIPLKMEEDFDVQSDTEADGKAKRDEVILVAFDYMRVKLGEFRQAQAFLPAIQKQFEDVVEQ